ncbi:MAG TPA: hypothetical protein VFG76_09050 [Candidatus Polarisedimenticolia bacterium]|nr:hypothetical protein [Candidatus Polarisedimenticolia bacterium]
MIILSAIVAGLTAIFVLSPLLGWGGSPAWETRSTAADRHAELLTRRQTLLGDLKDLEIEFEVGKLTKEDFEQARERLSRQAVETYRELDKDGNG